MFLTSNPMTFSLLAKIKITEIIPGTVFFSVANISLSFLYIFWGFLMQSRLHHLVCHKMSSVIGGYWLLIHKYLDFGEYWFLCEDYVEKNNKPISSQIPHGLIIMIVEIEIKISKKNNDINRVKWNTNGGNKPLLPLQ